MSGPILKFEGSDHHEVERLLPWFVNGTLEADERALVAQHLEHCPQCKQELAELFELRAACLQTPPPAVDESAGWRRVQARLHTPERSPEAHARRARSGDRIRSWRRAPRWLRAAFLAQTAAVLAIAAAWTLMREPPADYRTLSAAPAPRGAANTLVIVFDPDTPEARMRQLLRASQAHVIDGPNEAGAYVIEVPDGQLATVRAALRAAPGVSLVASLAPEAER